MTTLLLKSSRKRKIDNFFGALVFAGTFFLVNFLLEKKWFFVGNLRNGFSLELNHSAGDEGYGTFARRNTHITLAVKLV